MRRIVLTYGLIAGAILALVMVLTFAAVDRIDFDHTMAIGYTTMFVAFLTVFFGIRSYRDDVAGGSVRFGRAAAVGALIALVGSACYVATWETIYFGGFAPDFWEQHAAYSLEKARASGASEAAIAAEAAQMRRFEALYANPFVNAGMTFLEVLPVGLVMTLASAGILARRRSGVARAPVGGASPAV